MLCTALLLVSLSGIGGPTPTPPGPSRGGRVVSGRTAGRFADPSCLNPNVLANRDVVKVARFDSFGTVAMQREATKAGWERLRVMTEHYKGTRPAMTVGGAYQEVRQRQDQFVHK